MNCALSTSWGFDAIYTTAQSSAFIEPTGHQLVICIVETTTLLDVTIQFEHCKCVLAKVWDRCCVASTGSATLWTI
jgi:hypothetical protein